MAETDLLQKCDVNNYANFTGALMLIFDLDPELLYSICDRDYIWRPVMSFNGNYIQWITQTSDSLERRDAIEEIFSYLYRKSDPDWDESYEFDEKELELRKEHLDKIEKKYGGLNSYLEIVSKKLWKEPSYLEENYMYVIKHN